MNSMRLRSPGDVVAVLPYQLGYHPHDSLVVVALRDRAVVLVERVDLPTADHADEASRVLIPPLLREEPDAVLLVGYEAREGESRPALEALSLSLDRAGLVVLDRMVVRDGWWFVLDCDLGCCPPEGSPVPSPAETPAVAEFVGLGVSPLPGRSSLAAIVAADPRRTPAVAAALAQRVGRRGGLGQAARRFEALSLWAVALGLRDGPADDEGAARGRGATARGSEVSIVGEAAAIGALRPDQVALLVESLGDIALRDALVAWLCPGSLPADCLSPDVLDAVRTCLPAPGWSSVGSSVGRWSPGGQPPRRDRRAVGRRYLVRLQHLVRAVPDEYAAPPLTVVANLAWWLGDGALARTCVERALGASPDYRLALLLERMLDLGVRSGGGGEGGARRADAVRAG